MLVLSVVYIVAYLKLRNTQLLWDMFSHKHSTSQLFNRTTCCILVCPTACFNHFHQKSPKNLKRTCVVLLQQSLRTIQSSGVSNQETHVIYGNMDVEEPGKRQKRKDLPRVRIFFISEDRPIVSRR